MHRAALIALCVVVTSCDDASSELPPVPQSPPEPFELKPGPGVPLDPSPAAPEAQPVVEAGPASGTTDERTAKVRALLAGAASADQLPVEATDPGRQWSINAAHNMVPPAPSIRPRVRLTTPTVSEGLPVAIVRRVVRMNLGRFRFCYTKELEDAPELEGKITIDFTIKSDGKVGASKASQPFAGSKAVTKCFVTAVKQLEFPKPQGDKKVEVSMPFDLASL